MGSTISIFNVMVETWDHPHIHGEHDAPVKEFKTVPGSPPYTWGARKCLKNGQPVMGITPIYMGSTSLSAFSTGIFEDHPHIHGEHTYRTMLAPLHQGSPPYTWGAQKEVHGCLVLVRITPIYMGSTQCRGPCERPKRDHPHIHGEHKEVQN